MSIRDRPPRCDRTPEQVITALLPDVDARRPAPQPVPLPSLPAPQPPATDDPDSLLIGLARVDRSGRIHARALLRALGWEPGHPLEINTSGAMITIASAAAGRHRVDDRATLTLPAAARRMCGIPTGPTVVLVAVVPEQTLLVHPAATVARLLAALHTAPIGVRDAR